MIRSLLLLSSALLVASAYTCNGTVNIDAPSDLSQPTYYPVGWTEDKPVPEVAHGQGCFFTVNIPLGVYATVTFYKKFGPGGSCYVLYSNNKYKLLEEDDDHPFLFTSPKFIINLSTSSQLAFNSTQFAFKIVWSQYPDGTPRNEIDLYKKRPPVVVSANKNLTTFLADSDSLISLVAFSLPDPSMNYLLRQSAIYAGYDFNGEFVGTLEQVVASQVKLTTYKNLMSVYTFGLSDVINYPLFMAQDYSDTVNYPFTYVGANCPSTGNCNVTLSGRMGNSYTVTDFIGSEIIKDFTSFPDTATVNVYQNTVSDATLVATLTSSTYKSQLPIEVKGTLKYYSLVGHGNVEMVVTRDTSRANRV